MNYITPEQIADIAEQMEANDPTDSFWREFATALEPVIIEQYRQSLVKDFELPEPSFRMISHEPGSGVYTIPDMEKAVADALAKRESVAPGWQLPQITPAQVVQIAEAHANEDFTNDYLNTVGSIVRATVAMLQAAPQQWGE